MARDQIPVSIAFRDVPLFRRATLCDVDGSGGFVPTESPMPVGTVLLLSPLRNPGLRVPARVALVVEACRTQATEGESAGMNVTFEEAGESLLDYLEAGADEELAQLEVAGAIERPHAPPSPAMGPTPKVIVEGQVESTAAPSPISQPGERRTQEVVVLVSPPGGSDGRPDEGLVRPLDPDAPDKEVVELEAEFPEENAVGEKVEGAKAEGESPSPQPAPGEEAGEEGSPQAAKADEGEAGNLQAAKADEGKADEGEEEEEGDGKKKRRGRRRRRK